MLIAQVAAEHADLLPMSPGSYILVLRADQHATITVGRLGALPIAPGWVLYTGSAFGTGGLRGRVRHHLRPVTRPHWHIDYLRRACTVVEIWYSVDAHRWEHAWAAALAQSARPIPGFGASDCHCVAHAFHQTHPPELARFVADMGRLNQPLNDA